MKFRKKSQPNQIRSNAVVPSGTVIDADGIYFFVKGDKKYRILSQRIIDSQNYPRIVKVTAKAANAIPNAVGKIGFRESTIIKPIGDSGYYLISNNKTRLITNPDVFIDLQIDLNDVILVSTEEFNLHERGEDIGRL